ncbi:hypothetical protein DHD32_12590 [Arenibacter sp. TNZ]|nr:hypothetical protein [Arenibacter sp. TNZ]
MAIAAIRNINGQPHATADIYTPSLNLLKKKAYENSHFGDSRMLRHNLYLAHQRLSQLDSARYYADTGFVSQYL